MTELTAQEKILINGGTQDLYMEYEHVNINGTKTLHYSVRAVDDYSNTNSATEVGYIVAVGGFVFGCLLTIIATALLMRIPSTPKIFSMQNLLTGESS